MKTKEKLSERLGEWSIDDINSSTVISEKEREVLLLRLGGKTLDAVGEIYGITGSRVRQIENRAVFKLGKAVEPLVETIPIEEMPIEKIKELDISKLDIPIRAIASMYRSNVNTIGEVVDIVSNDKEWNENFLYLGTKAKEAVECELSRLNLL